MEKEIKKSWEVSRKIKFGCFLIGAFCILIGLVMCFVASKGDTDIAIHIGGIINGTIKTSIPGIAIVFLGAILCILALIIRSKYYLKFGSLEIEMSKDNISLISKSDKSKLIYIIEKTIKENISEPKETDFTS